MRRRVQRPQNASYIHPFINGSQFLFGVGEKPRTLCELAMTRLSADIRSKPEWWKQHKDPGTRKIWFNEAINKLWRVGPDTNNIEAGLAKHQINYVLDELTGYAALRDEATGIEVACFDRIWKSDCLLDTAERKLFIERLRPLHSSTDSSNKNQVLVDPLKHAYRHGRTSLKHPDDLESFIDHVETSSVSLNYTALPSLVDVRADSPRAVYRSYINGVDPTLTDLCASFQTALGRSIDLFDKVLTSLHRSNPLPQRIRGTYRYKVWDEPDPPEDSDEEAWEAHNREMRQWALYRPIEIPDVPSDGYTCNSVRFNHEIKLRPNQGIQVLHRVVDVHLVFSTFDYKNSDRAEVKDTEWHVEGMANEQIDVCCFVCLAAEGIEDVRLSFRMATTSPAKFMPHDVGATLRTWGLQSGDDCNQVIGSVALTAGLSIAFPNIYQHRLQGVRLREGCDTGRLVVLEFYLVDPDVPPIVSTADVAPQQREWIMRALQDSLDRRLPFEVLEKIVDMVNSIFSEEEAEKYRGEMVREREIFRHLNDRQYFCLPFSMDVVDIP